ncbi:MAG: hypothetical protein KC877_04615 [Candidatus Kaiserbacteria bacterium]|nr:hypothetical protein [Candidatus Kaiserbacteria bacterium]MCB9816694.1 hypothetical protein [Candidatus Nomurabacteria bacterium]
MIQILRELLLRGVTWLFLPRTLLVLSVVGAVSFAVHHYWDVFTAPAFFRAFVLDTLPEWGAALARVAPSLMARAFAIRWLRWLLFIPTRWLLDPDEKEAIKHGKEEATAAATAAFRKYTFERPAAWWRGKTEHQQIMFVVGVLATILIIASILIFDAFDVYDAIVAVLVFVAVPVFRAVWRLLSMLDDIELKLVFGKIADWFNNRALPTLWERVPMRVKRFRALRLPQTEWHLFKRGVHRRALVHREKWRRPIVAFKEWWRKRHTTIPR